MATHLFKFTRLSFVKVAKDTWSEIGEADVFGRAAQLAYYFFLALFPFLISVIAGLSVFGFADKGRTLMFQFLAGALPPAAFQLINNTINDVIHASGPLKMSAGVLASLWAASAGMRAVMDALNATYRVKETRSFVKQYGVAVGMTLAFAALVVGSVLIILFGNTVINALSLGDTVTLIWKIVQWPIAVALILTAFGVTYYLAPNLKNREWHWVTPGAMAGVAGWLVISIALRIYLHFFNSYSATYGSLGAVIILLLWFYLSGIALLSGAALNGILERAGEPVNHELEAARRKQMLMLQIAKSTPQTADIKTMAEIEEEIAAKREHLHADVELLKIGMGTRIVEMLHQQTEKRSHAPIGVVFAVGIGALLRGFADSSQRR